MSSRYAASALLALTLPHALAAPAPQAPLYTETVDEGRPLYPLLNTTAAAGPTAVYTDLVEATGPLATGVPEPVPEPVEVSSLTGGVLTSPDVVKEPFPTVPLDPGIGDGSFPVNFEPIWHPFPDPPEPDILPFPTPIPIEPGIGDGTGPEAFGDPVSSAVTLPTEEATPIDIILVDPIPPSIAIDPPVVATPIPEIIEDPLPPPLGPPNLTLKKFVSLVQHVADVISSFFTVLPEEPEPIPYVAPDVASALTTAPTASPELVNFVTESITAPFPIVNGSLTKKRDIESHKKHEDPPHSPTAAIKAFIKKWHKIGTTLSSLPPELLDQLIKVFTDETIDQHSYPKLGKYPDHVRIFMLEFYQLAQVLNDYNVPDEDKIAILKALLPNISRKRHVEQRADDPVWNPENLKKFIKLFWEKDPLIGSLSGELDEALFGPLRSTPAKTSGAAKSPKGNEAQVKEAVLLWTQFREFLASLDPADRAQLEQVMTLGQQPVRRSMRHGLRRRQSEDGFPDLGVQLDDAEKLGSALNALGPEGSLDPLGLSGAAVLDFGKDTPANTSKDDGKKPAIASTKTEDKEKIPSPDSLDGLSPTALEYIEDYGDVDDSESSLWDPDGNLSPYADGYADVPGGVTQNWVSRLVRALVKVIELNACRSKEDDKGYRKKHPSFEA